MIDVKVELIADPLSSCVIHGWNTGRLLKHNGMLYALANVPSDPTRSDADWSSQRGLVFRRPAAGNGTSTVKSSSPNCDAR